MTDICRHLLNFLKDISVSEVFLALLRESFGRNFAAMILYIFVKCLLEILVASLTKSLSRFIKCVFEKKKQVASVCNTNTFGCLHKYII